MWVELVTIIFWSHFNNFLNRIAVWYEISFLTYNRKESNTKTFRSFSIFFYITSLYFKLNWKSLFKAWIIWTKAMHVLVLEGMTRMPAVYRNESWQATVVFQLALHARFSIAGVWQCFFLNWKRGCPSELYALHFKYVTSCHPAWVK